MPARSVLLHADPFSDEVDKTVFAPLCIDISNGIRENNCCSLASDELKAIPHEDTTTLRIHFNNEIKSSTMIRVHSNMIVTEVRNHMTLTVRN